MIETKLTVRNKLGKRLSNFITRKNKNRYTKGQLMRSLGLSLKGPLKEHVQLAYAVNACQKYLPQGMELVRFKCNPKRFAFRKIPKDSLNYTKG